MKNAKKGYLLLWAATALAFLLAAALLPDRIGLWSKKDSSLYVSVAVVLLVYAGNLLCTLPVLDKDSRDQRFLSLPLIYISFLALGLTFAAEMACVFLPGGSDRLGAVIGIVILAAYGITTAAVRAGTGKIEQTDREAAEKTAFMRNLRAEAGLLAGQAQATQVRKAAEKVSEALRYSDPCSAPELKDIEEKLTAAFSSFSEAVKQGQEELSAGRAEAFLLLLKERNEKCRLFKQGTAASPGQDGRQKKPGSYLSAAGIILLTVLAGSLVFLFLRSLRPGNAAGDLQGRWTADNGLLSLDFQEDGTLRVGAGSGLFGADCFTYEKQGRNTLKLQVNLDGVAGGIANGVAGMFSLELDYTLDGDEMTIKLLGEDYVLHRKE